VTLIDLDQKKFTVEWEWWTDENLQPLEVTRTQRTPEKRRALTSTAEGQWDLLLRIESGYGR
jgi:hypothetical protein